jgi:hypothetical protein
LPRLLFLISRLHMPSTPVPWNWSGFYFGAHAGYRWADVDANAAAAGFPSVISGFPGTAVFPLVPASATFHPNSGAFGLLTGQNFVLSNPFLVGWEADVTWGRGRASTAAFSLTSNDADIAHRPRRKDPVAPNPVTLSGSAVRCGHANASTASIRVCGCRPSTPVRARRSDGVITALAHLRYMRASL